MRRSLPAWTRCAAFIRSTPSPYATSRKIRNEEEDPLQRLDTRAGVRHELDGLAKGGDLPEDDLARAEKELDRLTHAHEAEIDSALEHKETELLEV